MQLLVLGLHVLLHLCGGLLVVAESLLDGALGAAGHGHEQRQHLLHALRHVIVVLNRLRDGRGQVLERRLLGRGLFELAGRLRRDGQLGLERRVDGSEQRALALLELGHLRRDAAAPGHPVVHRRQQLLVVVARLGQFLLQSPHLSRYPALVLALVGQRRLQRAQLLLQRPLALRQLCHLCLELGSVALGSLCVFGRALLFGRHQARLLGQLLSRVLELALQLLAPRVRGGKLLLLRRCVPLERLDAGGGVGEFGGGICKLRLERLLLLF